MNTFKNHSDRTTRNIVLPLITAIIGALFAVHIYSKYYTPMQAQRMLAQNTSAYYLPDGHTAMPTKLTIDTGFNQNSFIYAAEKTVHAVVHVKTKTQVQGYSNPLYEFFYGRPYQPAPIEGFGSGVIVTETGYIVTNNHVIDKSNEIEVILNDKRKFTATIVGKDPSTDIALLKIEAKDLPFIPYGNSDELRIGEWVLAIGNPFNLTSSVTAGIVSAKGRNLELLNDQYRIESFIQTDAALNPGNSGGALVNLRGQLVGINTAILSPSGAYAGNSFAVPVTIVKKVVADLIEFGEVQRAILGVTIQTVDAEVAKKFNLDEIIGVYVESVKEGGAADEAGIKAKDIIIEINNVTVNSTAEIQEEISKYRPGAKISVTVLRNKERKTMQVTLQNLYGSVDIVKSTEQINLLGAEFKNVPDDLKNKLGINHGVRVNKISDGKFKSAGIKEGFIILSINNTKINNVNELKAIISKLKGGVYIEGIYPNGVIAYYAFGI